MFGYVRTLPRLTISSQMNEQHFSFKALEFWRLKHLTEVRHINLRNRNPALYPIG